MQKNNLTAIVTLGPSILDENKLKTMHRYGRCIYRINGAHVNRDQATQLIGQVRGIIPDAPIMMCLPGNKMRTANLSEPIRLIKGECFVLRDYDINYPMYIRYLKKGDTILSNDSNFTFEITEVKNNYIKLLSHSNGMLQSNKGLNVKGIHGMVPFLFDRDLDLIDLAREKEIGYLALSFVRTPENVREVKRMLNGSDITIIAKIETLEAVKNLNSILEETSSILIDRGDLSTEVGIMRLGEIQDAIIKEAVQAGKDVYLATQFLKNMETKPIPLIPEIIDLTRTLRAGITGIQLSEETAIGKYPLECVKMVFEAFRNVEKAEQAEGVEVWS